MTIDIVGQLNVSNMQSCDRVFMSVKIKDEIMLIRISWRIKTFITKWVSFKIHIEPVIGAVLTKLASSNAVF